MKKLHLKKETILDVSGISAGLPRQDTFFVTCSNLECPSWIRCPEQPIPTEKKTCGGRSRCYCESDKVVNTVCSY